MLLQSLCSRLAIREPGASIARRSVSHTFTLYRVTHIMLPTQLRCWFDLVVPGLLLLSAHGIFLQHASAQHPSPLQQTLGQNITVELRQSPAPHFVLSGLTTGLDKSATPADCRRWFHIQVDSDEPQTPALLGEYQVDDSTSLQFHPRFPLSPSVVYRLVVGPALLKKLEEAKLVEATQAKLLFQLPAAPPATATTLSAIYPTAQQLPENLLKFYLHFSAPMSRGQAYQCIQLWHGNEVVDKPFLELGEELWDGDQQRFTLFIHPGRIKHGLRSRDEAGPALLTGQTYTLRIDPQWRDAKGFPLAGPTEKTFTVTASDDAQLDPIHWQIESPAAGSQEPVVLQFDEPLDHAMLSRVLDVKARGQQPVAGSIQVADEETEWRFVPEQAWKTGTYHIEVATILEDLCGNSLAKPFEVNMKNRSTTPPQERIAIEFIVK
jgi:hypothetical protein